MLFEDNLSEDPEIHVSYLLLLATLGDSHAFQPIFEICTGPKDHTVGLHNLFLMVNLFPRSSGVKICDAGKVSRPSGKCMLHF